MSNRYEDQIVVDYYNYLDRITANKDLTHPLRMYLVALRAVKHECEMRDLLISPLPEEVEALMILEGLV